MSVGAEVIGLGAGDHQGCVTTEVIEGSDVAVGLEVFRERILVRLDLLQRLGVEEHELKVDLQGLENKSVLCKGPSFCGDNNTVGSFVQQR